MQAIAGPMQAGAAWESASSRGRLLPAHPEARVVPGADKAAYLAGRRRTTTAAAAAAATGHVSRRQLVCVFFSFSTVCGLCVCQIVFFSRGWGPWLTARADSRHERGRSSIVIAAAASPSRPGRRALGPGTGGVWTNSGQRQRHRRRARQARPGSNRPSR